MVRHDAKQPTIAVLCVAINSVYKQFDGVDVYDIERDARSYPGGFPVVAHPPCRAWSAYCSHQAKPLQGEKELGPFCVDMVRRYGGVLEHPAHSRLWDDLSLPLPGEPAVNGLWSMKVKQSWFGDRRSKTTWLLISGVQPGGLPDLPFRLHDPRVDREKWNTMSKQQRSATPPEFARWLIDVARRAKPQSSECDHQWKIDGAHFNEYCGKCFVSKPESEAMEL